MASIQAVTLPSELEQVIFEQAAILWPRSILRFLLVAHRVKIWVEPILYRTITILNPCHLDFRKLRAECSPPFPMECNTFLSLIRSKGPEFFRRSVRNLYLCPEDGQSDNLAVIFEACSGIENLCLVTSSTYSVLQVIPSLKRLHCVLGALKRLANGFTITLLSSLTHLDMFDMSGWYEEELLAELAMLPCLTHLALVDRRFPPKCLAVLPAWNTLRVLIMHILLVYAGPILGLLEACGAKGLEQDRRFVLVDDRSRGVEDWVEGARTGNDSSSRKRPLNLGKVELHNYYLAKPDHDGGGTVLMRR
ncbi:hypothetical protein R3P38DRAFT_2959322 [Favolaschia claudopus]|uniref:F-box domain-containing protein n=1 Tax=Favolaschia claudopus TaxID=2862362 RepID=A0AAW0B764_9AGAR